MTSLERTLGTLVVLAGLLVVGWLGVLHYGAVRYDAGYADAVGEGMKAREALAAIYRETESDLHAQLRARDDAAFLKEKEHAASLEAAQRRMRAGLDSLRCPARPVPDPVPPATGSAASAPTPDGRGPELVPEAAADVLGIAGHIAELVRRYAEVEEWYAECRALNAK